MKKTGKKRGDIEDPRAEMERILRSIDRPRSCCASGRMFAPVPAFEVAGAGPISFPVPESQISAVLSAAASTSGGNGCDIGPKDLRLGGGGWERTFTDILDAVAEGLGCPRKKLEAKLRGLAVRAAGKSLFPDDPQVRESGETAAVLAVVLPVSEDFEGGDAVVRRGGEETVLSVRAGEPSEIAWAAFCADLGLESRPVTSGSAMALFFDLELAGGPGMRGWAPDFGKETERMARALGA